MADHLLNSTGEENVEALLDFHKLALFYAKCHKVYRLENSFFRLGRGFERLNHISYKFIRAIRAGLLEETGECDASEVKLTEKGKALLAKYKGRNPLLPPELVYIATLTSASGEVAKTWRTSWYMYTKQSSRDLSKTLILAEHSIYGISTIAEVYVGGGSLSVEKRWE